MFNLVVCYFREENRKMSITKKERFARRKKKTRSKLSGTQERPRLCVYKSLKHLYAQVVDDTASKTLASASTYKLTGDKGNKTDQATSIGTAIADACKSSGIQKLVFDRSGYQYHGRVKAVAEAVRAKGIEL